MKSIKIMLIGIMLVMVSLFLLGICVLNVGAHDGFYPELPALICLIAGAVIFVFGVITKVGK